MLGDGILAGELLKNVNELKTFFTDLKRYIRSHFLELSVPIFFLLHNIRGKAPTPIALSLSFPNNSLYPIEVR